PFDGSNFSGIYFEYKTSSSVDAVKFVVSENTYTASDGTEYHVILPGTNGSWSAARVDYSALTQPSWVPAAQRHSFRPADLSKMQFGFYDTLVTGSIAVDNVYFLGDDNFIGQAPSAYNLTYTASPLEGGAIRVGGVEGSAVVVPVAAGGTGPAATAIPSAGYVFVGWQDGGAAADLPGYGPVTEHKEFIATFAPLFTVTYKAGEGGKLRVAGSDVTEHTVALPRSSDAWPSVQAVPNTSPAIYRFVRWSDGATLPTRIDNNKIDANVTFTAEFEAVIDTVTFMYSAGEGGGLLVGSENVGQEYSPKLIPGQSVTVTAVPLAGYAFAGWNDDVSKAAERTDAYARPKIDARAAFTPINTDPDKVTLVYLAGNGGKVQKGDDEGNQVFEMVAIGETGPAVTAKPNEGYHFVKWSDDVDTETRSDVADADMTVTAEFASDDIDKIFTISYSIGEGGGGKLIIGDREGEVDSFDTTVAFGGSAPTISPAPEEGYTFLMWSDSSTANPRFNSYIQADVIVYAIFEEETAVAANNREVPPAPNAEVSVITPLPVIAGELTAGPNPASKQTGAVNFFRTGQSIKTGKLLIYDAYGNLVTKLNLSDKNTAGKRIVAAWNLKDAKNRPVAEGTYIAKGAITTKSGAKEKVSALIAVVK
ncbi:MAG: InlB B-repeat-containing protein, partial [Chitinispirillales bacterium]|nr:InlB B-repeat-containing protein [Chitinispirillales bacterium]